MKHARLPELSALLDDSIGPSRAPLLEHLAECESCNARHARFARQDGLLARLLRHDPPDAWHQRTLADADTVLRRESGLVPRRVTPRPMPTLPAAANAEPPAAPLAVPPPPTVAPPPSLVASPATPPAAPPPAVPSAETPVVMPPPIASPPPVASPLSLVPSPASPPVAPSRVAPAPLESRRVASLPAGLASRAKWAPRATPGPRSRRAPAEAWLAGLLGGTLAGALVILIARLPSRNPAHVPEAPPAAVTTAAPAETIPAPAPAEAASAAEPTPPAAALSDSTPSLPAPPPAPSLPAPAPAPVATAPPEPTRAPAGEKTAPARPAAGPAATERARTTPRHAPSRAPDSRPPSAVAETHTMSVTAQPVTPRAPATARAAAPAEDGEAWPLLCGVVVDDHNEPIPSAEVRLSAPDLLVKTDRRGHFCLSAPAGPRSLTVSATGFAAVRLPVRLGDVGGDPTIILARAR